MASCYPYSYSPFFATAHRFCAACLAISDFLSFDNDFALATPPFNPPKRPNATAAGFFSPAGSSEDRAEKCGAVSVYCPLNSSHPIGVSIGYYTVDEYNYPMNEDSITRTMAYECPSGSYCDGDSKTWQAEKLLTVKVGKLCKPGLTVCFLRSSFSLSPFS